MARALSRADRHAWRRTLVFQHIEDLNAVFDSVRHAGRSSSAAEERARRLVARSLRAAGLVRATAIEGAWAFVAGELDRPEDAFGPAVLLLGLAPDDPRVRTWSDSLPRVVLRVVKRLGLIPVAPTRRRMGG